MKSTDIKLILCDLDGVLRTFPKGRDEVVEYKYDLTMGCLKTIAFEKTLIQKAITGKISDKEWKKEVITNLKTEFPTKNVKRAVEEWDDFTGVLNKEVLDIIIELKKNTPVYLITNGTDKLNTDLEKLGLNEVFDQVINSSKVGFEKPKREIFDYALNHSNLKPSEIFFIDDSKAHTDAALKIGMKVHTFISAKKLKTVCSQHKLLEA